MNFREVGRMGESVTDRRKQRNSIYSVLWFCTMIPIHIILAHYILSRQIKRHKNTGRLIDSWRDEYLDHTDR